MKISFQRQGCHSTLQEPFTHTISVAALAELKPGEEGILRQLDGGKKFISRLAALGFTPGAMLQVIRNNYHGPILVSIRGTQIAIGQEEAKHIRLSLLQKDDTGADNHPECASNKILIALAGQPNVGKSTVFNLLTGLNQHVGNWAGKTVDLKSGSFHHDDRDYSIIDLPGTYSLTASSEEERITREFILHEKPGVVVAVVDAATLERNLYLIAELLLLPAPIILALNMIDVAEQEGIHIESKVLETALGIPVVPMSAAHGQGIQELLDKITALLSKQFDYQPNKPSILPAHEMVLKEMMQLIEDYLPPTYPLNWAAIKLLEGDEAIIQLMQESMPAADWERISALLYSHEDAILDIAGARYEWIARMIRVAVVEPKITRVGFTSRLDRVFTHPVWGTISLVGILGIAFWLTYAIGSPIQTWLSGQIGILADNLRIWLITWPAWIVEFFATGVLGGVGMVLTFLPILVIFYAILGLMEDTGYLARAAYLTDRWMHMMGLHGKSFMPILLGFGCNVPAVLGTRIIESKRARLLTILLIPLIPCTARLAVITVLVPLFFGSSSAWVAWAFVVVNVVLLALLGWLLHHIFFEDEHVAFIMELPLYHMPNTKTIGLYIWHNITEFIAKAGTTILVAALIIWAVSYFPNGNIMTSYLGWAGQHLEPVGQLMGLPWPVMIALLTSFVAKENTIATLGVLYGNITTALPSLITIPAALALIAFQMLFIPCIATVASIRNETRSWKWTALSLVIMSVLAFGIAIAIYQIGSLF